MTSLTKNQAIEGLQKLGLGVLEAVTAVADVGAPGGALYAAMQAHGASYNQFTSFMHTLTSRGYLTLEADDCYRITAPGTTFMETLQRKFGAAKHCRFQINQSKHPEWKSPDKGLFFRPFFWSVRRPLRSLPCEHCRDQSRHAARAGSLAGTPLAIAIAR